MGVAQIYYMNPFSHLQEQLVRGRGLCGLNDSPVYIMKVVAAVANRMTAGARGIGRAFRGRERDWLAFHQEWTVVARGLQRTSHSR